MRKTHATVRCLFAAVTLACASACSLAVSDYEVDETLDAASVKDFGYTFKMMIAHAGTPLDVALVDKDSVLQARARIILPPVTAKVSDYPDEVLAMQKAVVAGPNKVYFYVDTNGNNRVDGSKEMIVEHIWIKDLDESGIGEFVHSTMFQFFDESAFTTLNGDVVFDGLGGMIGEQLRTCITEKLAERVSKTLEFKVFLANEDRQVGYFKTYKNNDLPPEVRLRGIVDGGNEYNVQVWVDGEKAKDFTKTAPPDGDLKIGAVEWLPVAANSQGCALGK